MQARCKQNNKNNKNRDAEDAYNAEVAAFEAFITNITEMLNVTRDSPRIAAILNGTDNSTGGEGKRKRRRRDECGRRAVRED